METNVQDRTTDMSQTGELIPGLAEEDDLWARRDSDPLAREELVNRYLAFAKSVALRYRSNAESLDDLVQVASLGLVNAVNRFDPSRGVPFIAFASPTITGELKRHFRDRTSMMRIPRSLYDRIGQIDFVVAELTSRLNREPTIAEPEFLRPLRDDAEGGERRAVAEFGLIRFPAQAHPGNWLENAGFRKQLREPLDQLSAIGLTAASFRCAVP